MKFQLMSDLHLEFGAYEPQNKGAEVLLLSGDVFVAADFVMADRLSYAEEYEQSIEAYHKFMESASKEFDRIIHINGNHEHYNGDVAKTSEILEERLFNHYPKAKHLNMEHFDFGNGVCVAGITLWTDFGGGDWMWMSQAGRKMNDYNNVIKSDRPVTAQNVLQRFEPEDAYDLHREELAWLEQTLEDSDSKFVVMSHHAPSYMSSLYSHKSNDSPLYASNLDEFIESRQNISVWCHGHVHQDFNYKIKDTRILCSPRGYHGHELRTLKYNHGIIFEV